VTGARRPALAASAVGGGVLAAATHGLASLRSAAKPLHPSGEVCVGRLHRHGAGALAGVPWLDEPGEDGVDVRRSRAVGLPDTLPDIVVAIGGDRAARLAAELADGVFATEPKPELLQAYSGAGGTGPRYAEVPLAYAPTEQEGAESAHRLFRFGLTGWKVQAELPNPVNFEAATAYVRPDDVREMFGCGPDVARHLTVARQFADAGFDHLALINAGPDVDAFLDFYAAELAAPLRSLDTGLADSEQ